MKEKYKGHRSLSMSMHRKTKNLDQGHKETNLGSDPKFIVLDPMLYYEYI